MELESITESINAIRKIQKQINDAYKLKKFPQCLEILNSAIDIFKQNFSNNITLGNLEIQIRSLKGYIHCIQFDQYENADAQFNICSAIDPFHSIFLKRKGQAKLHCQNYHEALDCFNKLLLNQPESKFVQNKIKKIQCHIKEQKTSIQDNIKQQQNVLTTSVRFGSFEIIQIDDLESDESQARIQKGVQSLSKSTKSILKDTFSAHSSINSVTQDGQQAQEAQTNQQQKTQIFEHKKIKSIQKTTKKIIFDLDDASSVDSKIKFKKQHSMYEKDVSIEKQQQSPVSISKSQKKIEKKSILKKSKSVAFRNDEYKQ